MSRPRRGAYFAGLSLCLLVSAVALTALPRMPRGATPPEALRSLGSACTGLTLLAGFVAWRQLRRQLPPPAAMDRALLAWTPAFLLPALFAWLLWQGGGAHPATARHARAFALLPAVMFFALVPRPRASGLSLGHGPS